MGISEATERPGSYGYRKDELGARLKRIEGQVRGVARMVEDEKYCVDILVQVAAIRAALDRVALGVLEDHVKGCVAGSEPGEADAMAEELLEVLERFVALRR
ncbi:MAG: metal-sensitive transcriptional regulator [Actinomycetota bacterium]